MSKIRLLGGIIQISGEAGDQIIVEGQLKFQLKKLNELGNKINFKNLKKAFSDLDINLSANVSVRVKILDLFNASCKLKLENGLFCS